MYITVYNLQRYIGTIMSFSGLQRFFWMKNVILRFNFIYLALKAKLISFYQNFKILKDKKELRAVDLLHVRCQKARKVQTRVFFVKSIYFILL